LLDFERQSLPEGSSETFKVPRLAELGPRGLRPAGAQKNIKYINGLLSHRPLSQKLCKTVMFVVPTGCELPPIHDFMIVPRGRL
jgi:hypothetical protein